MSQNLKRPNQHTTSGKRLQDSQTTESKRTQAGISAWEEPPAEEPLPGVPLANIPGMIYRRARRKLRRIRRRFCRPR